MVQLPDDLQVEFVQFLQAKREQLKLQMANVEAALTKLKVGAINHSNGQVNSNPSKRAVPNSFGWKHKIDEVLKEATAPVPSSHVIDVIMTRNDGLNRGSIAKSISSVLSVGAKEGEDQRYIQHKEMGTTRYSLK